MRIRPWGGKRLDSRGGFVSPQALLAASMMFALTMCSRPEPIDFVSVRGRVMGCGGFAGGATGTPVVNARVRAGTNPPVTTDTTGAFRIDEVPIPYDLVVLSPNFTMGDGNSSIAVYPRLRRADPIVQAGAGGLPFNRTATVNGTVTGASLNNLNVVLSAESFGSGFEPVGCSADSTTGQFSCTAQWYGPDVLTGKLRALTWAADVNGLPTDYIGFAEHDVALTSGATSTTGLTLANVGEATVSVTLSAAAGVTVTDHGLAVAFANPAATIQVHSQSGPDTSFSYLVPTIPGAFVAINGNGETAEGFFGGATRRVPAAAASIQLEIPVPPLPTEPADAATDVGPGSFLRWAAVPGAIYQVVVLPSTGGPWLQVTTDRPEFRIPDLSALGAALQPNMAHSWFVLASGPCASIDAAADQDPCGSRSLSTGFNWLTGRTFTTRP